MMSSRPVLTGAGSVPFPSCAVQDVVLGDVDFDASVPLASLICVLLGCTMEGAHGTSPYTPGFPLAIAQHVLSDSVHADGAPIVGPNPILVLKARKLLAHIVRDVLHPVALNPESLEVDICDTDSASRIAGLLAVRDTAVYLSLLRTSGKKVVEDFMRAATMGFLCLLHHYQGPTLADLVSVTSGQLTRLLSVSKLYHDCACGCMLRAARQQVLCDSFPFLGSLSVWKTRRRLGLCRTFKPLA